MSGELVDTQFARNWLPWGRGKRKVGTDLEAGWTGLDCPGDGAVFLVAVLTKLF